jgi:hypothetical protein
MNIIGTSIPANQIRNSQVGDWEYGDDWIAVKSANLSDWRYELLVQVHELVEAALCKHRGITDEQVTAFDALFEEERKQGLRSATDEDGDDPRACYHREHIAATMIERLLAMEIGVEWKKYESEIYSL